LSLPGSPSLEIERRARAEHAVVAMTLAVLGGIPWFLSALSLPWAAILSIGACASAALNFWHAGWLGGKRRLRAAQWTSGGDWYLSDVTGRRWQARLTGGSHVLGNVVWLRFLGENGSRHMLLVGSRSSAVGDRDAQRRLIARLRLQAAGPRALDPGLPELIDARGPPQREPLTAKLRRELNL